MDIVKGMIHISAMNAMNGYAKHARTRIATTVQVGLIGLVK